MENFEKIIFKDKELELEILLSLDKNTAYLSQAQIAKLYGKAVSTISEQIKKLYSKERLEALTSVDNFDISTSTYFGKTEKSNRNYLNNWKISNHRPTKLYCLEVVLEIGAYFRSKRGQLLKEFVDNYLKGKSADIQDNIIVFNNGKLNLPVNVSPEEETVWLNQTQIADLFETTQQNVSLHIKNIIAEGELDCPVHKENLYTENSFCKTIMCVSSDNKQYAVDFYNLDMILAIGYRVKSRRAIEFRRWATNVLKQYMIKGHIVDSNRVVVTVDNFISLENDVKNIKNEIKDIKEKVFIEPVKERLFFNGEYYDAYEFLCSIVESAKNDIIVIDPFFDYKGMKIMEKTKANVKITVCLSKRAGLNNYDTAQFRRQYSRINVIVNNKFHDRFIIIDKKECYSLGTSINYAGRRTFAVNKMEDDFILKALINEVL